VEVASFAQQISWAGRPSSVFFPFPEQQVEGPDRVMRLTDWQILRGERWTRTKSIAPEKSLNRSHWMNSPRWVRSASRLRPATGGLGFRERTTRRAATSLGSYRGNLTKSCCPPTSRDRCAATADPVRYGGAVKPAASAASQRAGSGVCADGTGRRFRPREDGDARRADNRRK